MKDTSSQLQPTVASTPEKLTPVSVKPRGKRVRILPSAPNAMDCCLSFGPKQRIPPLVDPEPLVAQDPQKAP